MRWVVLTGLGGEAVIVTLVAAGPAASRKIGYS